MSRLPAGRNRGLRRRGPDGVLAVVPARGGSKGLPGKNIRPFAGLPLIAHSILLAKLCPDVGRCVVSTDSEEIAAVARGFGAEVPFLRPAGLAGSDTPMWPVLRHALNALDPEGARYGYVLLLDPTSPTRLPGHVRDALRRLKSAPSADGIISASRPEFNPLWHCVAERKGWMVDVFPQGASYSARQDAPALYRINGLLYLWRAEFLRRSPSWRPGGRHLLYETPEERACSIDDLAQFRRMEVLVQSGLIPLPWLRGASRPIVKARPRPARAGRSS